MAQRTPAKPTSRFWSLSTSCGKLFLKRGRACSQRPPLARSNPCCAEDVAPPVGGFLVVWAARLPEIRTRRRGARTAVDKGLGIKTGQASKTPAPSYSDQ